MDSVYNLKRKYSVALSRAYNTQYPNVAFLKMLGIPLFKFKPYIEALLKPGMNPAEYGKAWAIGHLVPLSRFNLNRVEDCHLAYNYLNLIPMPAHMCRLGYFGGWVLDELKMRESVMPGSTVLRHLIVRAEQHLKEFQDCRTPIVQFDKALRKTIVDTPSI